MFHGFLKSLSSSFGLTELENILYGLNSATRFLTIRVRCKKSSIYQEKFEKKLTRGVVDKFVQQIFVVSVQKETCFIDFVLKLLVNQLFLDDYFLFPALCALFDHAGGAHKCTYIQNKGLFIRKLQNVSHLIGEEDLFYEGLNEFFGALALFKNFLLLN